jgi:hypothetical protein
MKNKMKNKMKKNKLIFLLFNYNLLATLTTTTTTTNEMMPTSAATAVYLVELQFSFFQDLVLVLVLG